MSSELYRAKVTKVANDGGVYVEVPNLATGMEFGPCEVPPNQNISVGDRVLVGQVEDITEDIVIIGLLVAGSEADSYILELVQGAHIEVDASDPERPVISAVGFVDSLTSVSPQVVVNNTDPDNPVISFSATGLLTGITASGDITVNNTNPAVPALSVKGTSPIGAIEMWLTGSPPAGWLVLDGSAVSRTTYAALFALWGTTFGAGNGSTTFNLPNMKGRTPFGQDTGQAEFDTLGETGGSKTKTISTANMPTHTHAIDHDHGAVTSSSDSHSHTTPVRYSANGVTTGSTPTVRDVGALSGGGGSSGNAATTSDSHSHSVDLPAFSGASGSSGSGTPIDVLNPYMVMNFIVRAL